MTALSIYNNCDESASCKKYEGSQIRQDSRHLHLNHEDTSYLESKEIKKLKKFYLEHDESFARVFVAWFDRLVDISSQTSGGPRRPSQSEAPVAQIIDPAMSMWN